LIRMGLNIHPSVMSVSSESVLNSLITKMESTGKIDKLKNKNKLYISILEETNIICATLSFTGSKIFLQMKKTFNVLVIDEAAQTVEPSTLVPFNWISNQVYLVGDPSQLPATVLSRKAISFGYNMSLFTRMMNSGYPVEKLTTQYRMHPIIRKFPSVAFYGGLLKDGPNVEKETTRPWHNNPLFGPIAFYDIRGREEKALDGASLLKNCEAQLVVAVYLHFIEKYPQLKNPNQFGIISPYKGQVKLIEEKLSIISKKQQIVKENIEINTIDGFQGKEKDVIIFSAVRSKKKKISVLWRMIVV